MPLASGMEIGLDAAKVGLDAERDASEFHAGYCGRLLEKALEEVTFVLLRDLHN